MLVVTRPTAEQVKQKPWLYGSERLSWIYPPKPEVSGISYRNHSCEDGVQAAPLYKEVEPELPKLSQSELWEQAAKTAESWQLELYLAQAEACRE